MPLKENKLRTWIEIDTRALKNNISALRSIISPKCLFMAVVKSNAYGHGLHDFAKVVAGKVDWFGVDTIQEALRLRKEGIRKPILVLGYTLPSFFKEAAKKNISLTISTFESIYALKNIRPQPKVHIKIDTGMHRQGFLFKDLSKVAKLLKNAKIIKEFEGIYTHLAAPKDKENALFYSFTKKQLEEFKKAYLYFEAQGFLPLLRHAASTGAAILYPESHYDMVRIGIGLYGLLPSQTSNIQDPRFKNLKLSPILTWKALVSEVKSVPAGSYIGYDLKEKTRRNTKLAIIPIGYWHGYPRNLSKLGKVLISAKPARILGIISMDMMTADVTNISRVRPGSEVVLIGRQGKEEITAYELAAYLNTSHYEIITRINPLIKRVYI